MIRGAKTRKLGIFVLIFVFALLFGNTAQAADFPNLPALLELKEGPPRTPAVQFRTDEILIRFVGQERFQRLPVPPGLAVEQLIEHFRARADVIYAEPNYIIRALFVPNDQYYPFQWHLDNPVYGGIETEQAWDLANGTGVVVAVIDTGVAYEDNGFWYRKAPDLAGTAFVAGYDFVNNDTRPNDDNGHGTHVTGTIAQTTDNSTGVAGVAFKAAIMPVKVLDSRGSGTYADVADGIRFAADNGARIINLSLGGPVGSAALEDALAYAYSKGVTIVAAAGNDGAGSLSYPAAYNDYVIAVGATRYDQTLSYYSNYGPGLDLVAPGGDLNVDQNGDGYGDGVLQQTFASGRPWSFGYYFYQGTSMATPHVAGAAALVVSAGIASAPADVRNILESTAEDLGPAGRDNTYGWGLLNAFAALGGSPPPPPPPPVNQPPVANAGPDQTLTDNDGNGSENVTLDGSGSSDPDGTIVSYEWKEGSTVLGTSAVISVNLAFGDHTITLTVTDDDGASASDTVQISVVSPPPPPPPGPQTLFSDDFQSGELGNWTESNEPDWNVESPAEKQVPGHSSSNLVAHADNCDTSCVLTLTTALDVASYSSVNLSFWRYIDNNLDRGEYLLVEVFNGSSWIKLFEWTHGNGDDDTWRQETVDLTPYKSAALKIRFTTKESLASEEVELDDVLITVQ